MKKIVAILALFLVSLALPVAAQQQGSAGKKAVLIINTGSTNTPAYTIRILPAGDVKIYLNNRVFNDEVPRIFVQRLVDDLKAAQPLANLTTTPCFKSVSFGSATYLEYRGERSPDIECLQDSSGEKLQRDVNNILKYLNMDKMLINR